MKVLSLIQPWATLIVLGEKKIETRSWRPKSFRGELYIHASKKIEKKVCSTEPYKSVLEKHGYSAETLPIGAIIGKCEVVNYVPTEELRSRISIQEGVFGNYSDGRYGWILKEAKMLEKPIQAKGKLNIWEYKK